MFRLCPTFIPSPLVALLCIVAACPALAQEAQPASASAPQIQLSSDLSRNPPSTLGDALRSLAARSGVAFIGRVDRIDRQTNTVTITFAVLEPILGNPGPTFTLREWAGLWPLGRQRYTLGQRALFFLHAPGASGLSSPVDGQSGVVPVLPTAEDAEPQLDARWLSSHLRRQSAAVLAAANAISLTDTKSAIAHPNGPLPLTEPTRHPLPVTLRPNTVPTPAVHP